MEFFEALLRMYQETRDDSNPNQHLDVRLESLRWSGCFPPVNQARWNLEAVCQER